MTSRAHVEFDPQSFGLRVALTRSYNNGPVREVLQWEPLTARTYDIEDSAQPSAADWLTLPEDDARALYEALADHFGHAGHDIRALRRDYEAERGRVDKLINAVIAVTE